MEASAQRRPDTGGVFEYDDERQVLAHLITPQDGGTPLSVAELDRRLTLGGGPYAHYSGEVAQAILEKLQVSGDAALGEGGWTMTEQGYAKLTGPAAYEPPPMSEEQVMALHAAGQLTDEGVEAWRSAHGQETA